jgi:uncharacterized DUF497 family protein
MDFDWDHSPFPGSPSERKEVEESFEDPFGVRLMPEYGGQSGADGRYFLLGKSVGGSALFSVFWTDGKRYRVIQSRPMSDTEAAFYERRNADSNAWL